MRRICQIIIFGVLAAVLALMLSASADAQPRGPIYRVEVEGIVTSVTIDHLRRALHLAESADATVLIIQLQSNGGVLRAMRPFAGEIAKARVPVVVYVAPPGTQAGAAGALFLSAAHVSALAPDTSFGSPAPLTQIDAALSEQTRELVLDSVVSQIREWNDTRGRSAAWVDRAVREGVVLTNEQAIATTPPTVDLVAADQQELLTLLDGREIKLADGRAVRLATMGREVVSIDPTLWEGLRLALTNPTFAFILLVLGALAICLELAVPGTSAFFGVGIVLIVAAAIGLLALPLQWWALLLLVAAFGLIGAEFFAPTHGGLAVIGLALLIVGALNLIDTAQAPGVFIAIWVIIVIVLALTAFVAAGVWLALRNRDRPVATGREAMSGRLAQVRSRLDPEGMVFVEGALWQAISEDGVAEIGDWVRITAVHDLRLIVRRIDTERL